jgi:uncharacterized membrane protein
MIKKLRRYLFRGLLILLPAGATVLLFWKLYQLLDGLVLVYIHRLFKVLEIPSNPVLDLIALTALIIMVGLFGGNIIGRSLVALTNYLINKIPLVRIIYVTIQQILESVLRDDKSAFSKVVLVEYPRKGLYSIAFVTAETGGAVRKAVDEEMWSVFLPTTPNPTSGFLLFVPKKDTVVLDISIDQAARLIMSAGVIDENKKLELKPKIRIQKSGLLFSRKKQNAKQ